MLKVSKVLRRFLTSWNDGMMALPVLHGKASYPEVRVVLFFDVVLAYRATALFAPWNLTLAARAPRKLCQGRNSQETSETCPEICQRLLKQPQRWGTFALKRSCLTTKSWNPHFTCFFWILFLIWYANILSNDVQCHFPLHLSVDTELGNTPYPRTFEDDAQAYQWYDGTQSKIWNLRSILKGDHCLWDCCHHHILFLLAILLLLMCFKLQCQQPRHIEFHHCHQVK